jgi:hypothetical protein
MLHAMIEKGATRRGRVLAALLLGTLLACSAIVLPSAASAASSIAPPTSASASPVSLSDIAVSWRAKPTAQRARFDIWILLTDTWTVIGKQSACLSCTSTVISGLAPGRTYTMGVVSIDWAGQSSGPAWATAATPADSCTGGAGICVSVDPARTSGALSHVGNGYNLGFTTMTPLSALALLRPRAWRISPVDAWAFNSVRQLGASVSVLLSNTWAYYYWDASANRVVRNPWEDWEGYRQFVVKVVQWHVYNNLLPDEWEIQNEPDGNYYGAASPPTRDKILQQFRVAHDAIRSVLPDAVIVGPSIATFDVDDRTALLNLTDFLDFAAAAALKFDVISWHELGTEFGESDSDPDSIVQHVQTVRNLLAKRPSLGNPRLSINEYGAPWYQSVPGASVRYFAALEKAGVASAQHSCFPVADASSGVSTWYDTCTSQPGLLNGLRTASGGTAADYWAHEAYAAMSGTGASTTSNNDFVDALATVAPDGSITVLIGRAHGCVENVASRCPAGGLDPTAAAQLRIPAVAGSPATYRVTVQRIANITGTVSGPSVISDTMISADQGTFAVPVPDGMADGDAVVIKLIPA